MALLPYSVYTPTAEPVPLIVDSPHSGRLYPVDFDYSCPLPLLRQTEDAYVDELVLSASAYGATVLAAEFPRSMIDVNRAEDDLDPFVLAADWPWPLVPSVMTLSGFGLVRRLCRQGVPLYRAPLAVAEVERRLAVYYRPYHACLRDLIEKQTYTHGVCYLINAHSMPDRVENGMGRADFILGDLDGASCTPAFRDKAKKLLQDMGYRVTCNDPYKGREIIKRYGLGGQGAHGLQMEINRKLYLDEGVTEKTAGFHSLRRDLSTFFRQLAALCAQGFGEEDHDRLAAE